MQNGHYNTDYNKHKKGLLGGSQAAPVLCVSSNDMLARGKAQPGLSLL